MYTELRKRLEEAADKYALERFDEPASRTGFMRGAEYGYKEAIARAKEWWGNYYKLPDHYHSETRDVQEKMRDNYEFHMKVVADFEADMNKLWEEKGGQ